jgi:hypothetical protein
VLFTGNLIYGLTPPCQFKGTITATNGFYMDTESAYPIHGVLLHIGRTGLFRIPALNSWELIDKAPRRGYLSGYPSCRQSPQGVESPFSPLSQLSHCFYYDLAISLPSHHITLTTIAHIICAILLASMRVCKHYFVICT